MSECILLGGRLQNGRPEPAQSSSADVDHMSIICLICLINTDTTVGSVSDIIFRPRAVNVPIVQCFRIGFEKVNFSMITFCSSAMCFRLSKRLLVDDAQFVVSTV